MKIFILQEINSNGPVNIRADSTHDYRTLSCCFSVFQGEVGPPGKAGHEGGLGPLGSTGPRGMTVQGKMVGNSPSFMHNA